VTSDQNEAVAHRWHLEVVGAGNTELADHLLAPDVLIHVNQQDFRGVDAGKQLAQALKAAFPDVQISDHEAIVSGKSVAIRWTSDGTHQGEYFGVPPTGKPIYVAGIDLFHLRDGKIAEMWIEFDNLALMEQMGVAPQPQQVGA
jgi:steroid delta-isomerase-like uncharacterized protein